MQFNEELTAEEKTKQLFRKQKEMLDTFLASGALTKAQYGKSLGGLMEKMGVDSNGNPV